MLAQAILCAGCVGRVTQAYDGPALPDSENVTLAATGDLGFRIDRTVFNQGVTAMLAAAGGRQTGSLHGGFPRFTKVSPSTTQITIHCSLPTSPSDARAFTTVHTYAQIPVEVSLERGRTYALRCERTSNGRVRGWIEIQP